MDSKQEVRGPDGCEPSFTEGQRARLIRSAQEVLATIGPSATVEEFVRYADVWPDTIDNYFGSKELMFQKALDQLWREWVNWAYGGRPKGDSLEAMIDVCRKLFRVGQTHPLFGKVLAQSLRDPDFVIAAVRDSGMPALEHVALRGQVAQDDFENRTQLWANTVAEILRGVHTTRELSPIEADASLAKALAIWGVSSKIAKTITSRPLGT